MPSDTPSDFDLHPDLVRDSHPVGNLNLCAVRLVDDATYPWVLLVPRRNGVRDTIDLSPADHALMWGESRVLSAAMMEVFAGEKLNVAALGNMTPQLHLHHVVRYTVDPAWPGPIWGVVPMEPYADAVRAARINALQEALPGLS